MLCMYEGHRPLEHYPLAKIIPKGSVAPEYDTFIDCSFIYSHPHIYLFIHCPGTIGRVCHFSVVGRRFVLVLGYRAWC